MRTFRTILASSVFFGSTGSAISTSGAGTSGQFGPGAKGGATNIDYYRAFTLQANFGGNGNPSSGFYGGLLNVIVSDVEDKTMFVVAASAQVSSTGSVMFNATQANYGFLDFQFIPSSASSSGFITVILRAKQDV